MAKRVIDISKGAKRQRITGLSYGASRSGKTYFAATFPRPLFISDGKEGGWETIRNMNREAFYEPDRLPAVWAVDSAAQMMEAIQDAEVEVKKGTFWSIVIDSLTFYVDGYLISLETAQNASGKKDGWGVYQQLASHLKYVMARLHQQVDVNILWLCLLKEPDMNLGQMGGPLIVGQMAAKAPALCDHLWFHRAYRAGQTAVHEIRTRAFGAYAAGGRDGGLLEDPINLSDPDEPCGFRIVEDQLGLVCRVPAVTKTVISGTPKVTPIGSKPIAGRK